MSDLDKAIKRVSVVLQQSVQGCDEFDAGARVIDAARRQANLTSPETIEKAATVIDSMMFDEWDEASWKMVTDVAEAVLRVVSDEDST